MTWPGEDRATDAGEAPSRGDVAGGDVFHISDNTISGPFAVGRNAQAQQWNQPAGELADALARAVEALDAAARPLGAPRYEEVHRDVVQLKAEVSNPRPDRDRVMTLLGQLTARAGSAAALLAAIDRIKDLLTALFH